MPYRDFLLQLLISTLGSFLASLIYRCWCSSRAARGSQPDASHQRITKSHGSSLPWLFVLGELYATVISNHIVSLERRMSIEKRYSCGTLPSANPKNLPLQPQRPLELMQER